MRNGIYAFVKSGTVGKILSKLNKSKLKYQEEVLSLSEASMKASRESKNMTK